jgi:hypothetical protein
MRNPRNLLLPTLVGLALGACSDTPTGVQAPAASSFDGGHVFGSGAQQTGSTTTAGASVETTATDTTAAARGGHVFGSGA